MKNFKDNPLEDDDEYTDEDTDDQANKKRKTRGPTLMSDLVHRRGGKGRIEVTYNTKGQPEGQHGSNLASFIGVMARSTVPIIYKNWKAVPPSLKDKIWDMVKKAFIVDMNSKKRVMSSAGKAWKSFKSTLTTSYIVKYKHQPHKLKIPPSDYDFILQTHWDAFVKSRLTEGFAEISEAASRRRALHLYDHRMSRKGYAKLEEELKLASGDQTDIDRSVLWKKARVDKDGNYLNVTVKQRAEKIDEVTQHVKDGIISTAGSNDILTMALEKPEYPGRVRGVGSHVTPNLYFNTPRCRSQSTQNQLLQQMEAMQNQLLMFTQLLQPDQFIMMQQMIQGSRVSNISSCSVQRDKDETLSKEEVVSRMERPKVREKFKKAAIKANQRDVMETSTKFPEDIDKVKLHNREESVLKPGKNKQDDHMEIPKEKPQNIEKVKIHNRDESVLKPGKNKKDDHMEIPKDNPQNIEKSKRCKLAVDNISNIVALGTVILLNGPIHGVPLGDANVRVSVDVPIKGEALLPIPIGDEIVTLRQAIGTHVAWPRNLVLVANEKHPLKNPNVPSKSSFPQDLYKMPLAVRFLLRLAKTMQKDNPLMVAIDSSVFGYEQKTYLDKDDITEFCSMEPISTVCMTVYMRHLWSLLKKDNKENLYGFADPSSFSHNSGKREERSCDLSVRFEKGQEKQLIFAPYNFGFHWVMAVINPYSDMVYYLDSLNPNDIDHELKSVIDVALKMFNAQKGRSGRKNPIWKIIQCPTQVGKVECGYYVMRFMKEIIKDPAILTRSKFNNQTYNQEEIDDVRVEWAALVDTLLQDVE